MPSVRRHCRDPFMESGKLIDYQQGVLGLAEPGKIAVAVEDVVVKNDGIAEEAAVVGVLDPGKRPVIEVIIIGNGAQVDKKLADKLHFRVDVGGKAECIIAVQGVVFEQEPPAQVCRDIIAVDGFAEIYRIKA